MAVPTTREKAVAGQAARAPLPLLTRGSRSCGSGGGCGGSGGGCGRTGRLAREAEPPGAIGVNLAMPHYPPAARFAATDMPEAWDITRFPRIGALLRSRKFQFLAILPNQIIFWMVIFLGIWGTEDPGLNFGTAITWYWWFCLLFVMMAVAGRVWCLMCPFGGFGEWVQRLAFWRHSSIRLTLGLKFPERLARYGAISSTIIFLALTWIEEFFNIAGPGKPAGTGWLVIGIVSSAVLFFVIFERRSFCRYLCPLTSLIAMVSTIGSLAGFRTRDRDRCLNCRTKECMRGGSHGAGCPWYTWPGAADSNAYCGLCTECYKACPYDNIGLYLQKPLTSVVQPRNRRVDIAWTVAPLFGLVLYQQINALPAYGPVDDWLNGLLHFPHYPDPVAYIGIIGAITALLAGIAWAMSRVFSSKNVALPKGGPTFLTRVSRFRSYFVPLMYGLIPVAGMDFFARQLPKLLKYATRVPVSVEQLWGGGSTHSWLYNYRILSVNGIIGVQLGVVGLGALASMWACWRIARRELVPLSRAPWAAWGVRIAAAAVPVISGSVIALIYASIGAAD
jgi:NosR/NirI family nitrous oxide reductase transcriptional regulator